MNEFERQSRERERILDGLRKLAGTGDREQGMVLVIDYFKVIGASDYVRAWEAIGSENPVQADLGQRGASQD